MNPLNFTNAVVSVSQPLQGLTNVTQKSNQLYDMQVDDTELRLLVADLYQHLGVRPRDNARYDAQNILQYMNQEQAYQLAQQKFMERQYAYMNGSVLERFRRFIGGNPLPPMHPSMPAQPQMLQPYPYPQAQMMYNPYQNPYQAPPVPPQNPEVESLKQDMAKLTGIVEQLAKNITGGGQS